MRQAGANCHDPSHLSKVKFAFPEPDPNVIPTTIPKIVPTIAPTIVGAGADRAARRSRKLERGRPA
jgi:hypothetical protein